MVGGVGFECARGTQALKGIALPAYGKYQHQAGRDLDSSWSSHLSGQNIIIKNVLSWRLFLSEFLDTFQMQVLFH